MYVPSAGTGDLILEHNVLRALVFLSIVFLSHLPFPISFFWNILIQVSFSGSHMHGCWFFWGFSSYFPLFWFSLKIAL